MADNLLWVRVSPAEKRAIRIAAAQRNMGMSEYSLSVLKERPEVQDAISFVLKDAPHLGQKLPHVEAKEDAR